MTTCRKTFYRAVRLYGGGTCLLTTKCRGAIDDAGRCSRCGGMYGKRASKPTHEFRVQETIRITRESF